MTQNRSQQMTDIDHGWDIHLPTPKTKEIYKCENCGKPISDYAALSASIMEEKFACSRKCYIILNPPK